MNKRPLDIAVVSDVHLGTRACRARELYAYLCGIRPEVLVLAGDIIDFWRMKRKNYFPDTHMQVLRRIMKMAMHGTEVYYVTGNHDEVLRRYSGFAFGNLHLVDQVRISYGERTALVVHGDFADHLMGASWLARMVGDVGYNALLALNTTINGTRRLLRLPRTSLSTRIKNAMPGVDRAIARYREICVQHAANQDCDAVICGHIHQPAHVDVPVDGQPITYLNSGDWVEHCTALEYVDGDWSIFTQPHTEAEPEWADADEDGLLIAASKALNITIPAA